MDNDREDELKQTILNLQNSLSDLVTNTYLLGFQDGNKSGLKTGKKEPDTLGNDEEPKSTSEPEQDKTAILRTAEQILKDYL